MIWRVKVTTKKPITVFEKRNKCRFRLTLNKKRC